MMFWWKSKAWMLGLKECEYPLVTTYNSCDLNEAYDAGRALGRRLLGYKGPK